MCKKVTSWVLALILLLSACALAGVSEYRDAIEGYYLNAIDDDAYAKEYLEKLVKYYTADEERQKLLDSEAGGDAWLYLAYARGRLAIENGEYHDALMYLDKCLSWEKGYKTDVFKSFASAMVLLEPPSPDYGEALTQLKQISSESTISVKCRNAIEKCEVEFKASNMKKAEYAMAKKDYETAKEYYNELYQYLPYDKEILEALNECIRQSGETVSDVMLAIESCEADSANSIKVKWKGDGEEYTVKWSMGLAGKTDVQSDKTKALEYTISGLEPGTKYLVTVECAGSSDSKQAETYKAGNYSESDESFEWTGSGSLYPVKDLEKLLKHLDSGKKWESFLEIYNVRRSKTGAVSLENAFVRNGAPVFVFTLFNAPKEELGDKPYTMLLHVKDGTVSLKGAFGDKKAAIEKDTIYLQVSELLGDAVKNYTELKGSDFTLELLIDGMFAASATGTFE